VTIVTTTATPNDVSGRGLLVKWANDQDGWIREIVAVVLETTGEPSAEVIAAVYEHMLVEKSLAVGERPEPANLVEHPRNGAKEATLTLVGIDAVKNVNALAAEQSIAFNPRMTVLFGRNGTGKTGYVRILKRLSSVRREQRILPDITATTPTKDPPEARVRYRAGETEETLEWTGAAGVVPFTQLDVFDAQEAPTYVDGELTYVYTPSDIALFRHVAIGVDAVRTKLEETKRDRAPGLNNFTGHLKRTVPFYAMIDSLGATTDMPRLKDLGTLSPAEEASLEGLRTTVEALSGQAVASQLRTAQADLDLCSQGLLVAKGLRLFDVKTHDAAIAKLLQARENQLAATNDVFATEALPGLMSAEWGAFVSAGEQYIFSLGLKDYPTREDHCIYCRQPLIDTAVALLKKYRGFCNGEHERETARATSALDQVRRPLITLDLRALEEVLRSHDDAKAGSNDVPARDARLILSTARTLRSRLTKSEPVSDPPITKEVEDAIARLSATKAELADRVAALKGQTEERAKALEQATVKRDVLEARLALRGLLPSIEVFVERSRWTSLAEGVLRRLKTTAKTLTDVSKLASERLVNEDFERHFREECERLNAPHVNLDFKGQKGAAARKKQLRPEYRLTDSLSEGEQKVIALADFLAEATLRTTSAPVVFDDPVTSLDYERIREVASRLATLAQERQVIIFTHNIWFAVELLERFRDRRDECAYYDVRTLEGRRGVVSGGTHPRSDSLSHLRKRINTCIAEGRKASGETQDALVFRGYAILRALCEVAVESELFHGVVRRYEPNIRLTVLPDIKPMALKSAGEVICRVYDETCRYIEAHSQPMEHLNVVKTIDELENDFKTVLAAIDAYKKAAA
jgi:recombinational DNA repair ATPase RecF